MGKTLSLLGIGLALLLAVPVAAAEGDAAALAAKLKEAKVSLQQGLSASAKNGKPISGKFEVEDGKLQLSVYTEKGGAFSEVVVDPKTGRVAKVEAIEGGEDLPAAKTRRHGQGQDTTWRRSRWRCQEESGLSARQRDPWSEGRPSRRGRDPHQG